MSEGDRELTQGSGAGARGVLDLFGDRFRSYLVAAATRMARYGLPAGVTTSDVVHETIVQALDLIDRGMGPEPAEPDLKRWLRAILAIMVRRHSNGRERAARLSDAHLAEIVLDRGPSPSSVASRDERARRLARARAQLDSRDRELLDWRYRDGLTLEAIGERLGVSKVAAHRAHWRALERVQNFFVSDPAATSLIPSRPEGDGESHL